MSCADVGLSISHPPSSRVCVFIERGRKVMCVCVCLFDWLTLLTSLIWTIKSVPVLRHKGYDGWSFTSQHLSLLPYPPTHALDPQKEKIQMLSFYRVSLLSLCLKIFEEGQWWSKPREGSLHLLFCSHWSVSECTPMQLCQLSLICLNPPLTMHTRLHYILL